MSEMATRFSEQNCGPVIDSVNGIHLHLSCSFADKKWFHQLSDKLHKYLDLDLMISWTSSASRDMKVPIGRLKVLCANTCQYW